MSYLFCFLENLFADSTLLLANAMFFKSVWKTAFDIKNTKIKCFNTPTGCLNTPMMLVVETFNYNFNTDLHSHVVEIPYQVKYYQFLKAKTDVCEFSRMTFTPCWFWFLPKAPIRIWWSGTWHTFDLIQLQTNSNQPRLFWSCLGSI